MRKDVLRFLTALLNYVKLMRTDDADDYEDDTFMRHETNQCLRGSNSVTIAGMCGQSDQYNETTIAATIDNNNKQTNKQH